MADMVASALTPSELVLLNGEQFASHARLVNKVRLPDGEVDVSAPELGQAVLAAAFLANHQAGGIRLETRQKKALLGLSQTTVLFAEPGQPLTWPEPSLEAAIPRLAAQLKADKGRNEVTQVIYAWMRADSQAPWNQVIELVQAGLAQRGLLEVEEQTKLKIFTSRCYHLPESTRSLAGGEQAALATRLLGQARDSQPAGWKLLNEAIQKAVKQRQEQVDIDSE
jgi:hypothetical protein